MGTEVLQVESIVSRFLAGIPCPDLRLKAATAISGAEDPATVLFHHATWALKGWTSAPHLDRLCAHEAAQAALAMDGRGTLLGSGAGPYLLLECAGADATIAYMTRHHAAMPIAAFVTLITSVFGLTHHASNAKLATALLPLAHTRKDEAIAYLLQHHQAPYGTPYFEFLVFGGALSPTDLENTLMPHGIFLQRLIRVGLLSRRYDVLRVALEHVKEGVRAARHCACMPLFRMPLFDTGLAQLMGMDAAAKRIQRGWRAHRRVQARLAVARMCRRLGQSPAIAQVIWRHGFEGQTA